jgi:hypothetical protein
MANTLHLQNILELAFSVLTASLGSHTDAGEAATGVPSGSYSIQYYM